MKYPEIKYKSPRDPNTPACLLKLRDVNISENIKCQVGSGECDELAVECQDDGVGGQFFICEKHMPEVIAFSKLVMEMTQNQINNLEEAVKRAVK